MPLVDYGNVCYFDLNAELFNKLDPLLKNCIQFIFNLREYDHVSALHSQFVNECDVNSFENIKLTQ